MKRILGVALGILTAIGGFLDIGDMVTNAVVGSRFGLSLAWVVVVGVIGICVFAQMSGRVGGKRSCDLRADSGTAWTAGRGAEPGRLLHDQLDDLDG
jgi:Mn2+/Fe2+ NRAMP family transporter